MGYLPQHALDNLKKYAYKGVDKCVSDIASSSHPYPRSHARLRPRWHMQVARFALSPPAILDVVCHPLAHLRRPEHRASKTFP